MIVNVEQSSFSGVVLNVSRLVEIKEIIGSKMFGKSRFKVEASRRALDFPGESEQSPIAKRTRSSANAKSTARSSCLVGVSYDISRERMC